MVARGQRCSWSSQVDYRMDLCKNSVIFGLEFRLRIVGPGQFTSACALVGEPGNICWSQIESFQVCLKSFKYKYVVVLSLIWVCSKSSNPDQWSHQVIYGHFLVAQRPLAVIPKSYHVIWISDLSHFQSLFWCDGHFTVIHVPFTVVYSMYVKSNKVPPHGHFDAASCFGGPFFNLC